MSARSVGRRGVHRAGITQAYIWDLADHFLVHCPRCDGRARVAAVSSAAPASVRLTCGPCGLARDWEQRDRGVLYSRNRHHFPDGVVAVGDAVDWYFHLPLWLQAACCGEILWAYNEDHLTWLRGFVSARIRERVYDERHGWSNQALASRLPRWLKLASNRDRILATIDRLEKRAA